MQLWLMAGFHKHHEVIAVQRDVVHRFEHYVMYMAAAQTVYELARSFQDERLLEAAIFFFCSHGNCHEIITASPALLEHLYRRPTKNWTEYESLYAHKEGIIFTCAITYLHKLMKISIQMSQKSWLLTPNLQRKRTAAFYFVSC